MTPTPRRAIGPRLAPTLLGLGCAVLLGGCGSSHASAHVSASAGGSGSDMTRYVQTWGTDYDHTTCAQWNKKMTAAQRWTGAYDLLRDNRSNDASLVAIPSDTLVTGFQTAVTTACGTAAKQIVADVADTVYTAAKASYQG